MEDHVRAQMVQSPPQHWHEIRRRARVVRNYLAKKNATREDLERHAAALGIGVRLFYNLVRAFRERSVSHVAAGSRFGRGYSLPVEQHEIIEQAIADLGPSARDADVRRRVDKVCTACGLPPPSPNAIWRRTGRTPDRVDLATRFCIRETVALDSSPLDLTVRRGTNVGRAHLAALLVVEDGRVLAHALTLGRPTADDLRPLHQALASTTSEQRLAVPAALTLPLGGDLDLRPRSYEAGSLLRAVFGLRIGRVAIVPRSADRDHEDAVQTLLPVAAAIIRELVALRNLSLQPLRRDAAQDHDPVL